MDPIRKVLANQWATNIIDAVTVLFIVPNKTFPSKRIFVSGEGNEFKEERLTSRSGKSLQPTKKRTIKPCLEKTRKLLSKRLQESFPELDTGSSKKAKSQQGLEAAVSCGVPYRTTTLNIRSATPSAVVGSNSSSRKPNEKRRKGVMQAFVVLTKSNRTRTSRISRRNQVIVAFTRRKNSRRSVFVSVTSAKSTPEWKRINTSVSSF
mmetsp:Transcript_20492/g.42200  ORF Transcript_20492/g.42200 Transcript_20492/m.42200 type:complete len:207 (-) Transcript_20492:1143-1763(-)